MSSAPSPVIATRVAFGIFLIIPPGSRYRVGWPIVRAVVIENLGGPRSAHASPRSTRPRARPPPCGRSTSPHRCPRGRALVHRCAAELRTIPVRRSGALRQRQRGGGSRRRGETRNRDSRSGDRAAGIVFWGGLAERALIAPEYSIRLPDAIELRPRVPQSTSTIRPPGTPTLEAAYARRHGTAARCRGRRRHGHPRSRGGVRRFA